MSGSSEWQIDERQLAELNVVLQRQEDVLVYNCVTRSAQESKLFPVMPYLMNVMIEAYYRFPEVIREASVHVTPEQVGDRSREVSTNYSSLLSWATMNYYLNGRAWLIRTGVIRPQDNLEDLWTVTDWWLRFQRSYRRNSPRVNSLDAWDMNPSLPERTLQVFEADAHPVDQRLRSATTKFMASATQYSFLVNCESRSGLAAAGPYRLGHDLLMHTRDFTNLAECDLSWLDGVAGDIPYNNLTLAIITDGVRIEITDWGTPYTTPEEYSGNIKGVGLYTSDYLTDRYIPVGMDSATELADTLEQLADACSKATRALYSRYAGFTNVQMVEAGVYTYLSSANGISHVAGTYQQSQWEFIDERTRRFWPLFNEEYAMDSYLDNFAFLQGRHGSGNDYYMDPVAYRAWRPGQGGLPGQGRNSFLVSRHVLSDHDYSLRASPNGMADFRGTSSLPAKIQPYTTTLGRLSEAEANESARKFSSPLFEEPWASVDDEWVKWNWQSPEVDALYRYGQETSRLLKDQGSGVLRSTISELRTAAGEDPWAPSP